jgi:hypothetical protein
MCIFLYREFLGHTQGKNNGRKQIHRGWLQLRRWWSHSKVLGRRDAVRCMRMKCITNQDKTSQVDLHSSEDASKQ